MRYKKVEKQSELDFLRRKNIHVEIDRTDGKVNSMTIFDLDSKQHVRVRRDGWDTMNVEMPDPQMKTYYFVEGTLAGVKVNERFGEKHEAEGFIQEKQDAVGYDKVKLNIKEREMPEEDPRI